MEEAAGTLHRRGTSSFPVEARAGQGLRHRGKAVPLADRCGTQLGVPSAAQRGGWLVGRAPLVSLAALSSSRRGTWWGWGLWPHCLGGCVLLVLWWWGLSGRRRENHLVEARRRAALCVCPRRHMVVVRTWPAARLTGVGDGIIPTVRVAVVPILKTLEWRWGCG